MSKRTLDTVSKQDKSESRKRAKSGQACTICRKNKTRCDLPANPTEYLCHRCKTLGLDCSFQELDPKNRAIASTKNVTRIPRVPLVIASASTEPAPIPQVSDPLSFDFSTLQLKDLVESGHATLGERTRTHHAIQTPMTAMYEFIRRQFLPVTSSAGTYDAVNVAMKETQINHLLQL
jgi:hypothetical protein